MAEQAKPFLTFVDPGTIENTPAPEPTATAPSAETMPAEMPEQPEVLAQYIQPKPAQPIVRTYHRDMNAVMGSNNPRTMSEILQNVRQDEAVKESKTLVSPKNKLYLIASLFLLVIGFGALAFVVYRNYTTSQTLQRGQQLSLIQAETDTNVTLVSGETFKNRERVQTAFAVTIPIETINNIFFTKQSLAGLQRLPFADMVAETGGTIPAELAGTLDGDFMYGTYQLSQTYPFLILRVTSYDDAFDGIRAWEPLMVDHLGFLFNLPASLQANFNKSVFEDQIIANHAIRAVVYRAPQAIPETAPTTNAVATATLPAASETNTVTVTSTEPTIPTETSGTDTTATITPAPEITPAETPTPETVEVPKLPYQEGDTVLMYTFLNEHTILITTDPAVLQEMLFRLTNAQLLL